VLETLRIRHNRAYDNYEAMISETGPDANPSDGLARESCRG